MNINRIMAVGFAFLLISATAMAEERRWISSEGTTLKAEATAVSDNVFDLPIGTEVAVIGSTGRWLKVKTTAGKEGWVYAGRVSDTEPTAEVTGGDYGIFGNSMKSSQINTAKADSARSIRGLSPGAAQYAKDKGTPEQYRKALDTVLYRKISPKELKVFLMDGKIGEYALVYGGKK